MRLIGYVHTLLNIFIAIYGLNYLIVLLLYLRHRKEVIPTPTVAPSDLPHITVHVPVHNEQHVVERVIDHVAALEYPHDRLEIHILDDESTDGTNQLACARADLHRERGVNIQVLRRPNRDGSKASVLNWGLSYARGEYIAIFDADFCPPPDFLLQTVPHFVEHPQLGMVQTRWTYLNADYSLLTEAQTITLDGHYVVEQTSWHRAGLFSRFNGSGGIWRRRCIEDAGGWKDDTLCEDLDLSYRAQLAGWKFLYLPTITVPAELPPLIEAFKQQQSRWAQGWTQNMRKLTIPILRSRRMSLWQKIEALLHLTGYMVYVAILINLLLSLPLLLAPTTEPPVWVNIMTTVGGLGPVLFFITAQQQLYPDWIRRLRALPVFSLLMIGIGWYIIKGIWQGMTRWGGAFIRTPKFRIEEKSDQWANSSYRPQANSGLAIEVILVLYALCTTVAAWMTRHYEMIPLLLFYIAAFGSAVGMELIQIYESRQHKNHHPHPTPDKPEQKGKHDNRRPEPIEDKAPRLAQ